MMRGCRVILVVGISEFLGRSRLRRPAVTRGLFPPRERGHPQLILGAVKTSTGLA